MVVVHLIKDEELELLRVVSWYYVDREKSIGIKNIPGSIQKFDQDEVPTDFYSHATEYFVDENKLRRIYIKNQ